MTDQASRGRRAGEAEPGFAHGLVGVTLDGRYRLDAVLGEGGMGSVFRATQLAMDRKVAVKLLKPHLTSDEAALQRFAREARATLKVESPHAVKILDFGVTPHRDYYMVLEYLDGRTVQRELEIDGAFAPARVAHIARQALAALAAAHGQGLIHRDVKPDNLLLMRAGDDPDYTKILDFGVAKLMQGAAGEPSMLALTAAGMVFGTPEYMSPEQACGHPLDGRSDLYSLAVTMWVMLTAAPLFEGATAIEWLTHHVRTPAPRLAMVRPALAAYPELDDLLQRCLAKHRDQRPASADDMARQIAALAPTLARAPDRAPRPAALAPTPETPTRISSFVEAWRDPAGAPINFDTGSTVTLTAAGRRSRRGLVLALGGVAILALIGLTIGLAIRRSVAHDAPAMTAIAATAPPNSGSATGVGTGSAPRNVTGPNPGGATGVGTSAAVAPDAGVEASPADAGHAAEPRGSAAVAIRAPRNAVADEHLRAAEEALRADNNLRQLAEADLALRADPRSARAKYLLGDALIKSGDIDRGCAYLHALKRSAQARVRARTAGCPGD